MPNPSKNQQIYICSKPLQIMIAMILNQSTKKNYIYIVDSFHSAKNVSNSIFLQKRFLETNFFPSRNAAILAAAQQKPATIFIDSDIGLKTQLTLIRAKIIAPKTQIHVYEEGVGTYRTDIITNPLKLLVYRLTGTARHFGGSLFTKAVWIFNENLYSKRIPHLKHKARKIYPPLIDWIQDHTKELVNIFSPDFKLPESSNRDAAYLYLTDWEIDRRVLKNLDFRENFFVKPHPHIKQEIINEVRINYHATWLPAPIPAEIVLILLCSYYKSVHVIHSNSSAVMYMQGFQNLKVLDNFISNPC